MDDKAAKVEFVYKELSKLDLNKQISQNRIFISCPFGTHRDSTPSLSINLNSSSKYNPGSFYCFGCSEKGNWNKLAKQLGVTGFGKMDQSASYYPPNIKDRKKQMLEVGGNSLDKLIGEWNCTMPMPFAEGDSWRSIKGKVLHDIGATYVFDNTYKKIRIILPCSVYGELEGAIRASQEKEKISYLNSKGEWAKSKGLFPFDYVREQFSEKDYVILVEGSRDALRLIQEDLPAIAILGTQSWNAHKRDLILSLGKRVFVMMDGDLPKIKGQLPPGAAANKLVKASFKEAQAECKVLNLGAIAKRLGKKIDPANAPKTIIRKIKEIVL